MVTGLSTAMSGASSRKALRTALTAVPASPRAHLKFRARIPHAALEIRLVEDARRFLPQIVIQRVAHDADHAHVNVFPHGEDSADGISAGEEILRRAAIQDTNGSRIALVFEREVFSCNQRNSEDIEIARRNREFGQAVIRARSARNPDGKTRFPDN